MVSIQYKVSGTKTNPPVTASPKSHFPRLDARVPAVLGIAVLLALEVRTAFLGAWLGAGLELKMGHLPFGELGARCRRGSEERLGSCASSTFDASQCSIARPGAQTNLNLYRRNSVTNVLKEVRINCDVSLGGASSSSVGIVVVIKWLVWVITSNGRQVWSAVGAGCVWVRVNGRAIASKME